MSTSLLIITDDNPRFSQLTFLNLLKLFKFIPPSGDNEIFINLVNRLNLTTPR